VQCVLEGSGDLEVVDLGRFACTSGLLDGIQERFAARLGGPASMSAAYQDRYGDWILLQPSDPWELVRETACKLLVTAKPVVLA